MRATNLLTETDEPEVTERTRFWLTYETSASRSIFVPPNNYRMEHYERFLIRVEVSEATYRAAYNKAWGWPSDVTMPLDEHWWRTEPLTRLSSGGFGLTVYSYRGGHIDWEG